MHGRRAWLGVLMLAACSYTSAFTCAEEVVFPDPALRAPIQEALGLTGPPVDSQDLERLTLLLAGGRGIADLTGLEACRNLEQLYLEDNQILSLSPLAGLASLRIVSLSGNRISDIEPLADLVNLASLAIHGNEIVDLGPIAALPQLATLSIGNLVTDISPLVGMPRLQRLKLYVRPEADLTPLAQLTALTFLFLSTGQPMSGRIRFDPNTLSSLGELTSLHLHGYDIERLTDLADAAPGLTELTLQYAGVDDLSAVAQFGALTMLTLDWLVSDAESVDFSQLMLPRSVRVLTLEGDGIADLATLAGLESVTSLSLPRNQITDIGALEGLTSLQALDLSFNPLTNLTPLLGLTGLRSLNLVGVPFDRTEGSIANGVLRELRDRGVNITY